MIYIKKIISIITTISKKFVKDDKKILGRWKIENCDKKMNNKIDLSNEDHCGPCGQYILNKSLKDVIIKPLLTKKSSESIENFK
jgi:hypothetical protein